MTGAVIGALRVSLGLDTADFESKLNKSKKAADGFSLSISKGLAQGIATAAAGFLSFDAVINGVNRSLEKFGGIADKSASAGLDPEFFQGIVHGASLAGISMESLSSALDTFNKNAGLASEGKGKLVSQLQALNPELLKNIQLATDQESRIRLVADAVRDETDASRQAAIATAAFGAEGVRLVAILKDGGQAIDDMVAKAKDIGIVVSRDLIARADELGDKLDTASQIVNTKLAVGFVALAPLIADAAGWAAELMRLLGIAYDSLQAIENRQFLRPLQNELAETYNAMQPIKESIAEIEAQLAGDAPNGMILKLDLTEAKAKLAELAAQADQLLNRITELQGRPSVSATSPSTTPVAAQDPNLLGDAGLGLALGDPINVSTGTTNRGGGGSGGFSALDGITARLDALRQSLMTEEQLEIDSHARRLAEIQKFYEEGAIKKGEYDSMLLSAQQQHADAMTEIAKRQVEEESRLREQLVGNVAGIFGSLSTIAEAFGEKGLAAAKAFGVAEAIVNTAQGITKALAQGGIFGFAGAAAVAAAGAAQIATILSASKGSSTKPSVKGNAPAVATPVADAGGPTINLTLKGGGRYSRDELETLFRDMNDAMGDGMKLNVVGT